VRVASVARLAYSVLARFLLADSIHDKSVLRVVGVVLVDPCAVVNDCKHFAFHHHPHHPPNDSLSLDCPGDDPPLHEGDGQVASVAHHV
jgi:hypothetical protein